MECNRERYLRNSCNNGGQRNTRTKNELVRRSLKVARMRDAGSTLDRRYAAARNGSEADVIAGDA